MTQGPEATDFEGLLRVLSNGGVDFIVIGGVAAHALGSPRTTVDLDIVYARTPENLRRLAQALKPLNPYLRGAPAGLPFVFDAETIERGLNFTLTTDMGSLDVLGEVAGGGFYDQLLADSVEIDVEGVRCRCVTLERLIHLKRAAGRLKDLNIIAELEALLEERDDLSGER